MMDQYRVGMLVAMDNTVHVYETDINTNGGVVGAAIVTNDIDLVNKNKLVTITELEVDYQVQVSSGVVPGSTTPAGAGDGTVCLDKFIRPRAQGDEVNALQQFLQKQGFVLDATGFYGEKTKQAVKDFQEAFSDDILKPNDLTSGNGVWGTSTAKKASALGLCAFVK
jgi:peptidoglycan hydrolase-like protein with peptidoglycan-binding domain